MPQDRVIDALPLFEAGATEPPRVVIAQSAQSVVVCWHVEPGQSIGRHVHPSGQDTWIVIEGEGEYFADAGGAALPLRPGVVAIAPAGAIHGARNTGSRPLRFISVVAPQEAGFEPL